MDNQQKAALSIIDAGVDSDGGDLLNAALDKCDDVNFASSHGVTPLYHAARFGLTKTVKALLAADANTELGEPAIGIAAQEGHIEIVEMLIGAGANLDRQSKYGSTALLQASQGGKHEVVKLLLAGGAATELARFDGTTPLILASEKGYRSCVEALVRAGASVAHERDDGASAIDVASEEVSDLLVSSAAEPMIESGTLPGEEGVTLHQAVLQRDIAVVRALLDRGESLDSADEEGSTPLHYAAWVADPKILAELLERGACADAQNAKKETPLHLVAGTSEDGSTAVAERLLAAGASIEMANAEGMRPLHVASVGGLFEMAKFLLDRGAEVDGLTEGATESRQGIPPLQFAAYAGKPDVVGLLIERGADVLFSKYGMDALHMARNPRHLDESRKQAVIAILESAQRASTKAEKGWWLFWK